mmetsp:Transcript_5912/g.11964  ORF Transcript_5912/g.11964 Transcript_5912/m.11964 type:complete len:227 (+) Transcript_5912:103-783(+)|eukprot:CAMPEP_0196729264 /NCGR_PEP_ID=MMETSP1091-20130531/9702_1 /TAXON_ID=302021 /ORGANISM="Rhodomonas sp., Strain CCMP768" /LENGTH=226 /DNA_ID=CAMNT_0042072131 /DNA_START=103 /DNA_END=783 /DNA_ORIENTATION=-
MAKNGEIGKRLCRVVTYFSSFVLALSGLIFFIIGCYFLAVFSGEISSINSEFLANLTATEDDEEPIDLQHMPPFVWIPVVLGAIILFTSLLGCAGAKYYNRAFLMLYIFFVGIIFLFQLIVAAMLFADSSVMTGLGVEEQQQSELAELFNESSQAVSISFLVVLFVELLVIASACFFRNQISGDELSGQWVHSDLEKQAEAERDRKKLAFEMQSRRTAFGPDKRWY